ncbi:MAG: amidohydrolase [Rhodovulum sulfidophilum]|uniref:Amidohydrolase n=1 Tax=Rhodovulum sulfidophilum TaxID=35806 RepID=A0A2W5PSR9_RHOSU|nr:MAG: amidohydrolase [Rhodovulum sulfidophilum]
MAVINRIAGFAEELRGWRHELHRMPELDFDLFETAAFVAARLREIGVDEIHEGIAKTGIVALIHGRAPGPVIGLRADMDALPIAEATGADYASRNSGRMHACGHDGHTAILLGAARYLAETRNFAGSVALIFQPSEEMNGGGRMMCEEGMMARFGIARVFGLHNMPNAPLGQIATRPGPLMAATDEFEIVVHGRGGHAAFPHDCVDPVVAAMSIGQALQTLTARWVDPLKALVVGVSVIRAGEARNVIPDTALLGGTVRCFDESLREPVAARIRALAEGIAAAHGARAEVRHFFGYPVTANDPAEADFAVAVAREVVGADLVAADRPPEMGAEDFGYMLRERPGAYVFLGTGPGAGLHHPAFDYNDEATPIGASFFAKLVETAQPLGR